METTIVTTLPDISEVVPLSDADQPLIDDIVKALRKHNALNRFGLTLLHQHFKVADDEVMLEQTDIKSRRQMIEPIKKSELQSLDYTETSWRLDTGRPMMACSCVNFGGGDHQHLSRG